MKRLITSLLIGLPLILSAGTMEAAHTDDHSGAELQSIARLAYRLADSAELLSRLSYDRYGTARAAENLHLAASHLFYLARRDRSGRTPMALEPTDHSSDRLGAAFAEVTRAYERLQMTCGDSIGDGYGEIRRFRLLRDIHDTYSRLAYLMAGGSGDRDSDRDDGRDRSRDDGDDLPPSDGLVM